MKRTAELQAFIHELKTKDPRVEGEFHSLLMKGMKSLELGDDDCARLFDVSRPTVTRWRNRSTAPHRALRRPLCDVLKKEASKRLKPRRRIEMSAEQPAGRVASEVVAP